MPYKEKDKQREYQRVWRNARRSEYLCDKCCNECGSVVDLNIHHIDQEAKVSHRIWSWSEDRRLEELSKCVVLCYECHRDIHGRAEHGSLQMYRYHKCRCQFCKDENAAKMREYKQRVRDRSKH